MSTSVSPMPRPVTPEQAAEFVAQLLKLAGEYFEALDDDDDHLLFAAIIKYCGDGGDPIRIAAVDWFNSIVDNYNQYAEEIDYGHCDRI